MAQSNGVSRLKRMEFEFKGSSYPFVFNPEEYSQQEPNRVTVVQTKGGAFIDDFGGGVPIISFKGTTGFKGTSKDPTSGFKQYKKLRDMLRDFYVKVPPGTTISISNELLFYNYTDEEYWVVTPKTFSLKRSVARPLLYLYEVELICQRQATLPASKNSSVIDKSLPKVKVEMLR